MKFSEIQISWLITRIYLNSFFFQYIQIYCDIYSDFMSDDSGSECTSVLLPQIQRDEIGFGFVLRGASPCYVQAVDPLGPAAKAGMKVRSLCISYVYTLPFSD